MVSFSDVQVALALFAEGLVGAPVSFAAVEDERSCWPWVPAAAVGELPVPVGLETREQFRAIVLHQLLTSPPPEAATVSGPLFSQYYDMLEDIRAAAVTRARFPGAVAALDECQGRVRQTEGVPQSASVAGIVRWRSIGGASVSAQGPVATNVWQLTEPLLEPTAGPADSARIAAALVELSAAVELGLDIDEWPPGIEAPSEEAEGSDGIGHALDGGTPSEVEDRPGGVGGQLLSELADVPTAETSADESGESIPRGLQLTLSAPPTPAGRRTFVYDEWDYHEQRMRPAWCRVVEQRLEGDAVGFLGDVRRRHQTLRTRIRNSLLKLPPRERIRVHRSLDGDELDLDAAIEAIADRRSGAPADDRLRIRRDRGARNVATVFLLDLSASTSSPASPPEPEPVPETDPMDDPLSYGPIWGSPQRLNRYGASSTSLRTRLC